MICIKCVNKKRERMDKKRNDYKMNKKQHAMATSKMH